MTFTLEFREKKPSHGFLLFSSLSLFVYFHTYKHFSEAPLGSGFRGKASVDQMQGIWRWHSHCRCDIYLPVERNCIFLNGANTNIGTSIPLLFIDCHQPAMSSSDVQEALLPSSFNNVHTSPSSGLRLGDQEGIEPEPDPRGRRTGTHWLLTTAILLGDMFGLGALTIPADFARLGWYLGFGSLSISALGMCYSGILFARLAGAFPRITVFDQFGKLAYGRLGQRLVFSTIYACILITPVIFQITCTESLQAMLQAEGKSLGLLTTHAIIIGIMLPLAQVRHLEEVSAAAVHLL